MSRENVDLVKGVLSRWNAGERRFADEEIHPEMVTVSRGIMAGRPLRGREGVRRYMQEIDDQFAEWTLSVDDWRDSGDCVGVLGRVHFHGRESGVPLDFPVGMLFEIRNGQFIRFETFLDQPADAVAAAELRE